MELLQFVGEDANGDVAVQLQLDGENLNFIGWNRILGTL